MKASIRTLLFATAALIAASCSNDEPTTVVTPDDEQTMNTKETEEVVTPNLPQSEIEQDLYANQVDAGLMIYSSPGALGYSRIVKYEIDGKCLGYGEQRSYNLYGRSDKHLIVSADGATVKISLSIPVGTVNEEMDESDFIPVRCKANSLSITQNKDIEYLWDDPENTENPYPEIFGTIRRLSESSFEVVIPPNESGVMRDYDISLKDKDKSKVDYFGQPVDVYYETYIGMQQLPSAHPTIEKY